MTKINECRVYARRVIDLKEGETGWTTTDAVIVSHALDVFLDPGGSVIQQRAAYHSVKVTMCHGQRIVDLSAVPMDHRWPTRSLARCRVLRVHSLVGDVCPR